MELDRFLSFDKDHPQVRAMVEMYLDDVPHEKLCMVDVGAFDGKLASQFLAHHPHSTAYAIEPCKKNAKHLRRLRVPGLKAHRVAISDSCGTVSLSVEQVEKYTPMGLSSQANSLFGAFVRCATGVQEVRSLTMDAFCKKNHIGRIDLLDVNCEGSEFLVFGSTVKFLDMVNVVDLSLHGKHRQFLTPSMIRKKVAINRLLKKHGLVRVYGHDLLSADVVPVDHIRQIWIRREML